MSLIAEDTGGTLADALKTMQDSGQYGSMVFPLHDDPTDDEAGEHIVQERARIRREQVVIEDRVEARVLKEQGLWQDEEDVLGNDIKKSGGGTPVVRNAKGVPKPRPVRAK